MVHAAQFSQKWEITIWNGKTVVLIFTGKTNKMSRIYFKRKCIRCKYVILQKFHHFGILGLPFLKLLFTQNCLLKTQFELKGTFFSLYHSWEHLKCVTNKRIFNKQTLIKNTPFVFDNRLLVCWAVPIDKQNIDKIWQFLKIKFKHF